MKNLFNLPDSNYQFWKEFNYLGNTVSFDHLVASKHTFTRADRNEKYTIFFTFSHHVFTNSIEGGVTYPHSYKDYREFDPERYELSKNLPNIIANLPEQLCFHGGYGRYCACEVTRPDGSTARYMIVYKAWLGRGKMRFHIESAYPVSNLGRVKKVNFWLICFRLRNKKKLPLPPQ